MSFDPIAGSAARRANARLDLTSLRPPAAGDDGTKGYAAAGEGRVGKTFVTAAGSGYTTVTVTFAAPPTGGTQATGRGLLLNGALIDIFLDEPGRGYAAAPAVTITGDGTGATAASSLALATIWQFQGEVYTPMRTIKGAAAWRRRAPGGVPSTPKAVWGFRRLVPGYTGPGIQVVRASDGATLDIPFVSSHDLDYDAARRFGLGTTLNISVVYDQESGGYHLTQTVAANRPAYYPGNLFNGPGSPQAASNLSNLFNSVTQTWMDIPAALSFSTAACSAFLVGRLSGSYVSSGLFEFANATPMSYFYGNSSFRTSMLCGGQAKSSALKPRTDASIYGFTNGSTSGLRLFSGHESYQQSAFANVVTVAGGKVGYGGGLGSEMDWTGMVVYDRELTETDRQDLFGVLCQHNRISPQSSGVVIIRGDSIDWGLKSTQMRPPVRLIEQNLGLPARFYSAGRSGDEGIAMAARVGADVVPLLNPGDKNNILYCGFGTNDFVNSNATPQAVFDALMTHAREARAAVPSTRLVVRTVLNRGVFTTAQATSAAAYNALLRANGGSQRIDALVDYGADPDFGPASWTTGAYQTDGTHPNDSGYALMAAAAAAAIRSVWTY